MSTSKAADSTFFDGVKLKKGEAITDETVEELTNGKGEDDE